MNTKSIFLSACAMAIAFCSCSDKDEPNKPNSNQPNVEFSYSPDDLNTMFPESGDINNDYTMAHYDGGLNYITTATPTAPEGRSFAFSATQFFANIPARGGVYDIRFCSEDMKIEGVAMIADIDPANIPTQIYSLPAEGSVGDDFDWWTLLPLHNLNKLIDFPVDFTDISDNPTVNLGDKGESLGLKKTASDKQFFGTDLYNFDWSYRFPENKTGKARIFILKFGAVIGDLSIPGPDYKTGLTTYFVQLPQ